MAITVYDHVTDQIPDYEATLNVCPSEIGIVSGGNKGIEVHRGRGRSEERVILSDVSLFWFKLIWNGMSEDDHSTIFDWYHDPDKACRTAKTFWWTPPIDYDSHIYVVRFDTQWESMMKIYKAYGIAAMLLYVNGRRSE